MSEDSGNKGNNSWLLVLVLLAPLGYFLSIGPAILLHPHLPDFGQDALEMVYKPFEYLAKIGPLEKILEMYVNLWT